MLNCWLFLCVLSRSGSRWSGSGGRTCTSGEESAAELSRAQADADGQQRLEEWRVRSKERRNPSGRVQMLWEEKSGCKLGSASRVGEAASAQNQGVSLKAIISPDVYDFKGTLEIFLATWSLITQLCVDWDSGELH